MELHPEPKSADIQKSSANQSINTRIPIASASLYRALQKKPERDGSSQPSSELHALLGCYLMSPVYPPNMLHGPHMESQKT